MDGKIGDEKLEYDINREAEKISALSPEKINKYEYLTGEEILPSNQRRALEYTKFAYSPLGKVLEKTFWRSTQKAHKAIEDRGKQLAESNELIKKDFNIDRDSIPHEEQIKIFTEFITESLLNFII